MNIKIKDPDLEFLEDGPWDELYALTKRWSTDIEFYRDDLWFLNQLIAKYMIWIIKSENLDLVNQMQRGLFELNKKSKDLLEKLSKHSIRLGQLAKTPNSRDAGVIKLEHEHLEEEIADFVKSFRKNRKEVFKLTSYIIHSEELASIMGS